MRAVTPQAGIAPAIMATQSSYLAIVFALIGATASFWSQVGAACTGCARVQCSDYQYVFTALAARTFGKDIIELQIIQSIKVPLSKCASFVLFK